MNRFITLLILSCIGSVLGIGGQLPGRAAPEEPHSEFHRKESSSLDTASRPGLAQRPCPVALPVNEVDGETITCGTLTVPENHDDPEGRLIDITYAILHSHSLSPAPDPIVHLVGGPGVSGMQPWGVVCECLKPSAAPATLSSLTNGGLNTHLDWTASLTSGC